MKTPARKPPAHRITFEADVDSLAGAMAEAGQGVRHIMRESGLTKCQVTYRSSKLAKKIYGYPKGVGLATAWRNGTSALWQQFGPDLVAVAKARIQEEAPPRLIHPTPKVSNKK